MEYSEFPLSQSQLNFDSFSLQLNSYQGNTDNKILYLWKQNIKTIEQIFEMNQGKFSDPHLQKSYHSAYEDFLRKLRLNPVDEFSIHISVSVLRFYLNKIVL